MRHSSIDVLYVPIGLRKSITRMFKWLSILEKVKPNYTNVFEANIIAKYENRPYNLHAMCLADYPSSYLSKRAGDVQVEHDNIRSYTVPVSNINNVKPNQNVILLKNEWNAEMYSTLKSSEELNLKL